MAEDQVPRKLAYEREHPGVTILAPDRGRLRWRACFEGRLLPVRGHDLGELLDQLEEAGDPQAAGADPLVLPWYPGRDIGRHMYARVGDEPAGCDPYIGTAETAALATEACEAHNDRLARDGQYSTSRP